MKKPTIKATAKRYLEWKEKGPTIRSMLVAYIKSRLFILVILTITFCAYFYYVSGLVIFILTIGMLVGLFLRDIRWILGIVRSWPILYKLLDWDKIKKEAKK